MQANRFRQEYQSRMQQVVTYITLHLNEPLNLEALASISHFSPYHFHRIFSAVMGETPQDMVSRMRLELAANLLVKTAHSITEIALTCGFSSSSTFARSFKKYFGVSASEYARRGVQILPVIAPQAQASDFSPAEVNLRMMPGLHLAYIASMKGYSHEDINRTWQRLCRWAGARGLLGPETTMVGISFDDPTITHPEKCRYYACLSIPETINPDKQVGVLDIPPNLCAVFRTLASAEQIQPIYRFLYQDWLPDSGFQPFSFPCYEIYYETPEGNPQGKYLLDICLPVQPL